MGIVHRFIDEGREEGARSAQGFFLGAGAEDESAPEDFPLAKFKARGVQPSSINLRAAPSVVSSLTWTRAYSKYGGITEGSRVSAAMRAASSCVTYNSARRLQARSRESGQGSKRVDRSLRTQRRTMGELRVERSTLEGGIEVVGVKGTPADFVFLIVIAPMRSEPTLD
jgi:hypothetical protein